MNRLVKILIVVVVILAILAVARDYLIKSTIQTAAKYVTGAEVKIGGLSLSLLSQSMKISNFKMYNPAGFPREQVMVSIPDAAVRADVMAYFRGTLHVPYLRLNLDEVHVIRSKEGKLNVNSLSFAQQPAGQEKPQAAMKMQLDVLSLNIGKVVLEDYSGGATPKVTVYNVDMKDKQFKNITDPAQLGAAVMVAALTPVGLGNAFKLGAQAVQSVYGVGTTAVDDATRTLHGTTSAVKGLLNSFK